jgi:chromosomal replication initiator protein
VESGIIRIPLLGLPLGSEARSRRNPRPPITLHQFLLGSESRLVALAMCSVFEQRDPRFNPLVIHGPGGTGKSHLAHGLSVAWPTCYPHQNAQYINATDFTRELADAIETQALEDLRLRFRSTNLLIVEDLHHLAGKSAAQVELLHTFDALLAAHRRIVVTAAVNPAELSDFLPALRSRLLGGLVVPLTLPREAVRLAILKQLAILGKIRLTETAALVLAAGIPASVPAMFSALLQLERRAQAREGVIDVAAVKLLLAKKPRPRQPRLQDIAAATAKYFSLTLSELRGISRRRCVVQARDMAIYLSRLFTDASLQQIGLYYGSRDHSTIMHGFRKIESLMKTNSSLQQAYQSLQQECESRTPWKSC